MATVVLVRPGCTDYDDQKRIQGSLDLPLNDRGQSQLSRVIDVLRDQSVDAVFSGPCDPSCSVAEALAEALDVPHKEKDDLCNLDHGLWEGLSVDEVRRKFPRVYKQWEDAPETVCPPEGESVSEGVDRLRAVLKKPLRKYRRFVVVASEPLASLISCVLRGTEPDALCETMFGCCEDHLVEVIETSGSSDNCSGSSTELPLRVSIGTGN